KDCVRGSLLSHRRSLTMPLTNAQACSFYHRPHLSFGGPMSTRTAQDDRKERQEERKPNGKGPWLKIGPYWTGAGHVSVSVWQNEGKNGPTFSVNWQKRYRVKDDQYEDSNTLFPSEIPVLVTALQEAYTAILHEQSR